MKDIKQLLAELELIKDPAERERRQAEIMQSIIGTSPARATVTDVVKPPTTPVAVDTSKQPTVKNAQEQQQLIDEANRGDRILTPNRMESFSDEDLAAIIQNPSASTINPGAQEEVTTRENIDQGGLLSLHDATKDLIRHAGQAVGGAAELPTSGPIGLTGLLAKGGELATGADLGADKLLIASEHIREGVRQAVGISEPRNISETTAGLLASVAPVPGMTNPVGTIKNLAEYMTPLVIGSGPKRIMANFATALVADQGMRELTDNADTKYKTVFDEAGLIDPEKDTAFPEGAKWLGASLVALAGAGILIPSAINLMKLDTGYKQRPATAVKDIDLYGPPGLKTLERAGDLLKTYFVDEKQVLQDLYKRAGTGDFDEVAKMIDQDSQMTALMRINESQRTGQLATKSGTWRVNITPNQLMQENSRLPLAVQADVDMYLKQKNYRDLLLQRQAKSRVRGGAPAPDVPTKLRDVNQNIYELETRSPQVRDFSAMYQHITAATRNFLASGPNAMISQKKLRYQNTRGQNFVPTDTLSTNPSENLYKRLRDVTSFKDQKGLDNWYRQNPEAAAENPANMPHAIEMLSDYVRNALKSKMEHDVRGAFIRGVRNSEFGSETMLKATKADIEKYPRRIVHNYEGGKRKKYMTSELQATLLRFDPYVARFPVTFFVKRAVEQAMTGPATILSGPFAPTLALRDAVGGWIAKEPSMKGPGGPTDVVAGMARPIWAKMQLATVEMLQNNMQHIPFVDQAQRQLWAQQISNSYMNNYYHMSNVHGGNDASLIKGSIQSGKGIIREVMRSLDATAGQIPTARFLGRSAKGMLNGLSAVFDAIGEGPRMSTFVRNVEAGVAPDEAARMARNLTGDTMRSGRAYNPHKRLIGADASNKTMASIVSILGMPIEFAREATPYFNPMVQSMRKLGNAFLDDPLGTNIRAWTAVGLPGLISIGWNEMLGEEYNRHAFETRTSHDIATNMYFGMPGLPAAQGIQIPMPLEWTMFNSPFTTGLYSLMRGDETEMTKAMMMHIAGTSLENTSMIGFPQIAAVGLAAAGIQAPPSINPLSWKDEVYTIDEDNVGLLPQNYEMVIRSLFASIGTSALQSVAAFHDGGPAAFFEEFGHQIASRTPILKSVTTTPVSNFTPFSQMKQTKIDAIHKFMEIFEDQVKKAEVLRETKLPSTGANKEHPDANIVKDTDLMSKYRMSPNPKVPTTNPIILKYGRLIAGLLAGNAVGFTGLQARDNLFRLQVKSLRAYTAGRKDAFREWQQSVVGKDAEYKKALADLGPIEQAPNKKEWKTAVRNLNDSVGEAAKVERLYNSMHLDMGKRADVMKFIGVLETQRTEMIKEQLKLIDQVEKKMSELLIQDGNAPPGFKFDVTKHLSNLSPDGLN